MDLIFAVSEVAGIELWYCTYGVGGATGRGGRGRDSTNGLRVLKIRGMVLSCLAASYLLELLLLKFVGALESCAANPSDEVTRVGTHQP